MISGRLISRSCTTSWSDWNHGDLYLTADALVRVRLPIPTAEGRRLRDTVGPTPRYRDLPSADEAGPLLDLDPTNRCIRLDEVASARLHRGILNDRLGLTTRDGTRLKLLWLRVDPAYEVLADELPERLGAVFVHGLSGAWGGASRPISRATVSPERAGAGRHRALDGPGRACHAGPTTGHR